MVAISLSVLAAATRYFSGPSEYSEILQSSSPQSKKDSFDGRDGSIDVEHSSIFGRSVKLDNKDQNLFQGGEFLRDMLLVKSGKRDSEGTNCSEGK